MEEVVEVREQGILQTSYSLRDLALSTCLSLSASPDK